MSTIDAPHFAHAPEQHLALIHLTIPRAEIMTAMGPAFHELGSALSAQGIQPTGPWFAHHLQRPTDIFDFEVCSPVTKPVQPTGRVTNGHLRAARVARTVHHGAYDGLSAAWGEFVAWIEDHHQKPETDLWEVYLVGPQDSPNPADWRTELNVPLAT